ncbi:hypothetical protein [Paraburkholderia bonniea]|uniref:hypothetical protein n=1 Tax=Paraburkholderia bonniea TaxID=2152891 RepID=UPI001292077E|nr:hypothetical protein [Paraburkholderia bonniea]
MVDILNKSNAMNLCSNTNLYANFETSDASISTSPQQTFAYSTTSSSSETPQLNFKKSDLQSTHKKSVPPSAPRASEYKNTSSTSVSHANMSADHFEAQLKSYGNQWLEKISNELPRICKNKVLLNIVLEKWNDQYSSQRSKKAQAPVSLDKNQEQKTPAVPLKTTSPSVNRTTHVTPPPSPSIKKAVAPKQPMSAGVAQTQNQQQLQTRHQARVQTQPKASAQAPALAKAQTPPQTRPLQPVPAQVRPQAPAQAQPQTRNQTPQIQTQTPVKAQMPSQTWSAQSTQLPVPVQVQPQTQAHVQVLQSLPQIQHQTISHDATAPSSAWSFMPEAKYDPVVSLEQRIDFWTRSISKKGDSVLGLVLDSASAGCITPAVLGEFLSTFSGQDLTNIFLAERTSVSVNLANRIIRIENGKLLFAIYSAFKNKGVFEENNFWQNFNYMSATSWEMNESLFESAMRFQNILSNGNSDCISSGRFGHTKKILSLLDQNQFKYRYPEIENVFCVQMMALTVQQDSGNEEKSAAWDSIFEKLNWLKINAGKAIVFEDLHEFNGFFEKSMPPENKSNSWDDLDFLSPIKNRPHNRNGIAQFNDDSDQLSSAENSEEENSEKSNPFNYNQKSYYYNDDSTENYYSTMENNFTQEQKIDSDASKGNQSINDALSNGDSDSCSDASENDHSINSGSMDDKSNFDSESLSTYPHRFLALNNEIFGLKLINADLEEKIGKNQFEIIDKNNYIDELSNKISMLEQDLKDAKQIAENASKKGFSADDFSSVQNLVDKLTSTISSLRKEIEEKDLLIQQASSDYEITRLNKGESARIASLMADLEAAKNLANGFQKEANDVSDEKSILQKKFNDLKKNMQEILDQKSKEQKYYDAESAASIERNKLYGDQIALYKEEILNLTSKLEDKDKDIDKEKTNIDQLENDLRSAKNKLEEKEDLLNESFAQEGLLKDALNISAQLFNSINHALDSYGNNTIDANHALSEIKEKFEEIANEVSKFNEDTSDDEDAPGPFFNNDSQ